MVFFDEWGKESNNLIVCTSAIYNGHEVPRPYSIRGRVAADELRAQLFTLQVVGHAIRCNSTNMAHVREVTMISTVN